MLASILDFIMSPPLIDGGIKRCFCLTSDDVCRIRREYSWHPQLAEARRAGRRRPGVRRVWADRSVRRIQGRGHVVAASRLQLVEAKGRRWW